MNLPLVSIIIPCYNRQTLVRAAIESALSQSYPDIEVIVVDDGSTDDSWSTICSFGSSIVRLRSKNGGVSRARNSGISLSRGRFLKFLDSDDLLPPTAVSELVQEARSRPPNTIAIGDAECIDETGAPIQSKPYSLRNVIPGKEISFESLVGQTVQVSMPLFPRDGALSVGAFREDLGVSEDYDLLIRLYWQGYRPFYVPIISASVRVHDEARITTSLGSDAYKRLACMYEGIWHTLQKNHPELNTASARRSFSQLIWRMARRAAQSKHSDEASHLFLLAKSIGGRDAYVAHPLLRLLYSVLGPCEVEALAESLKPIIRTSLSTRPR